MQPVWFVHTGLSQPPKTGRGMEGRSMFNIQPTQFYRALSFSNVFYVCRAPWTVPVSPVLSTCDPLTSCSYGDMVEHFRVLEGAGQYCVWEESFASLNRLVDYYRSHSIAVERAVYLRDLQSNAPQPLPESSHNPYPNPYKNSPHRPHSRASPPEREASSRQSEPALGVFQHKHRLLLLWLADVAVGARTHSYWDSLS